MIRSKVYLRKCFLKPLSVRGLELQGNIILLGLDEALPRGCHPLGLLFFTDSRLATVNFVLKIWNVSVIQKLIDKEKVKRSSSRLQATT